MNYQEYVQTDWSQSDRGEKGFNMLAVYVLIGFVDYLNCIIGNLGLTNNLVRIFGCVVLCLPFYSFPFFGIANTKP